MHKYKKVLLSAILFLLSCFDLHAKAKSETGFGIVIGAPTGVNFKHFVKHRKNAVEGDFSIISNKLYLMTNYLWHDFAAFGKIEEGELPLFYGFSAGIFGNVVGIGGVVGAAYVFDDYPFDIFIKLSPTIIFEKNASATFLGGIGGRHFFK